MEIITYSVLLKFDKGKFRQSVTSLSGEQGAIRMIMESENCPRCAILKITKIKEIIV